MVYQASPPACASGRKADACSTFSGKATPWSFGGLIGSGRNYQDVTDTVREFIRRQVRVQTVINRLRSMGPPRSDAGRRKRRPDRLHGGDRPSTGGGDESRPAGRNRACEGIDDGTKYRGRKPTFTPAQFGLVRQMLGEGWVSRRLQRRPGLNANRSIGFRRSPINRLPLFDAGIRQRDVFDPKKIFPGRPVPSPPPRCRSGRN